jgi:hypothetical protein
MPACHRNVANSAHHAEGSWSLGSSPKIGYPAVRYDIPKVEEKMAENTDREMQLRCTLNPPIDFSVFAAKRIGEQDTKRNDVGDQGPRERPHTRVPVAW